MSPTVAHVRQLLTHMEPGGNPAEFMAHVDKDAKWTLFNDDQEVSPHPWAGVHVSTLFWIFG